MKKLIQILFILISIITITNGQTIYVAESVTEQNEPINAHNYWEIEPWGKSLFIILDSENQDIEGNIVYLFIDKYTDGKYQPYDSKSINIKEKNRRIKYDYKFTETGKYKLYYINVSQEKLASTVVTISEKIRKQNATVKRSNYYDNIKLIFCEKVLVGGTPIGITKKASLRENGGQIYVKLTNFSPLKTEVILVDFWRKEYRSFEYDEYMESKKFRIDPEWSDTYFKYKFPKAGEYKIVIYNQEEVLIKTGYINVLN
ncbi:MAG: hypothetical protein L3J41_06280 [Melioribacteraceae bacterium]|nr:hypothetical protein [Melioribacteraceae bacterium]